MPNTPKHIHKYLKTDRKENRNNATSAEAKLWSLLSHRKLEGRKFRRQHSINNYIVDFYCPDEKLIIELDGQVHFNPIAQEKDFLRDKDLEEMGFKIVRFENHFVFDDTDWILNTIRTKFTDKEV